MADTETRPAAAAPPASRDTRLGWTFLAVCVVNYAMLWPVMRTAALTMPPLWFGAWRMIVAAAGIVALLAAIGQLRRPQRRDLPAILVVGVVMIGCYQSLAMIGLQFVGAGRAALLGYTTSLWVTPFAVLVMGERLTRAKAGGLVLGLAGLAALFNPFDFDWSDDSVVLGNGMMMMTAGCWAVAMIYLRYFHRWNLTPLQLVPWQIVSAAVVAVLAAVLFEGERHMVWTAEAIGLVAFAGPILTIGGLWAANGAMRTLSPITASIGYLATPVLALLIGAVVLGEPLTANLVAGFALIIGGIVLMTLGDRGR
jgi:drug/metabolite transporter (DMT)-like permease